jgi:hypothetical protein
MLYFRNGPWFKSEGVGQLLISATMDQQLTPFHHEPRSRKERATVVVAAKDRGPELSGHDATACGQVVPRTGPRGEQVPRSRTVADSSVAVASRIGFGAGSSRDGWENFTRPSLDDWSDQAGPETLGLRRERARLRREEEPAKAPC